MDADLQHPPSTVPAMAAILGTHDVVIGCRNRINVPWPWHRRAVSKIANGLACSRLRMRGIRIVDPMSGFFGMRTDVAQALVAKHGSSFEPGGYKALFDMLKCAPRSTRIATVAYDFGLRGKGSSKMKGRHIWLFLRSVFT
jgi:dolichol-phosphate mannosyltransferase